MLGASNSGWVHLCDTATCCGGTGASRTELGVLWPCFWPKSVADIESVPRHALGVLGFNFKISNFQNAQRLPRQLENGLADEPVPLRTSAANRSDSAKSSERSVVRAAAAAASQGTVLSTGDDTKTELTCYRRRLGEHREALTPLAVSWRY
jgi:hypothetical protein